MEKLNPYNIGQQPTSNSKQTEQRKPSLSEEKERMSRLWSRMVDIYGNLWSNTRGSTATMDGEMTETAKTWSIGLRGVSNEHFVKGLGSLITSGKTFPPTLPEFRLLCIGSSLAQVTNEIETFLNQSRFEKSFWWKTAEAYTVFMAMNYNYAVPPHADRLKRMIRDAYEGLDMSQLLEVPEQPTMIEHKEPEPVPVEKKREELAKLKEALK